jgi:hypothetical protein
MSLTDAVPSLAGKPPQQHAGILFIRGGTFRMGSDKHYPEEAPVTVRYDDWKVTFKTIKGNLFTGTEESTNVPLVANLRQDPWGATRTNR